MDTTQLKRIPLFSDAADDELKQVATFAAPASLAFDSAATQSHSAGGRMTERRWSGRVDA